MIVLCEVDMGGREGGRGGWSDGGVPWLIEDERWFMTSTGFYVFFMLPHACFIVMSHISSFSLPQHS